MRNTVDDDLAPVSTPVRVLVFSWEYPPHINGGMGNHVTALVPALAEQGVDVHVVTPRLKGGEPVERIRQGVTVHRVELASWESGNIVTDAHEANSRMTNLAEAVVEEYGPFDLVHAHDWLVALSAFHFKHEYRWPLVATIHATERGRCGGSVHSPLSIAIDFIEWQLCYEAWRLIVASRYMAGQLADFFHIPSDKLDIIPNGVDASIYQRFGYAELAAFRRRFAGEDEVIVFHVGRLVHEKGVPTLVAAAPAILAEFPNVRFVIAGRGPMYAALQEIAAGLGVSRAFDFVGFVSDDDRDRLYRVADVAVFPSLYEPFGIVALEAMAAGTPVVVSTTGGLAEVVEDHETGLTHEPGNPESLAWTVRRVLRHPDEAETWAKTALDKARTLFSWHHVAGETARAYKQILDERASTEWS